jgi:hypothetical protein
VTTYATMPRSKPAIGQSNPKPDSLIEAGEMSFEFVLFHKEHAAGDGASTNRQALLDLDRRIPKQLLRGLVFAFESLIVLLS